MYYEKWLPEEGIQLWKVDSGGLVRIPTGVPKAVMSRPMKGYIDIVRGLNGYTQYWIAEGQRDVTGLYKYQYGVKAYYTPCTFRQKKSTKKY
jgi:hypothetical protein